MSKQNHRGRNVGWVSDSVTQNVIAQVAVFVGLRCANPTYEIAKKVCNFHFRQILIIGFLICPVSSQALNWESGYGASITAGYEDNYSLSPTDEIETSITRIGLYVTGDGRSELNLVQLRLALNADSYSDDSIDDRATSALSLSTSHQGETLQSNLSLSYLTEPTIETELLDTGIIVDSARDTLSFSTGISYNVSERNSLSANLGFSDVGYDTLSLNEYQNASITIGWGYQLSETSRFTTNFTASQFDPEIEDVTDNYSLSLGYEIKPSETTTYNFSVGASDVDGPNNSQTGNNYSISINHQRDELNSFSLTVSKSFQASGLGTVREQENLNLNWVHAFTEKFQSTLSAEFVGTDDRDYLALQPGASYNFSRNTSLSGYYLFKTQDSDAGDAESNSLLLTLSIQY